MSSIYRREQEEYKIQDEPYFRNIYSRSVETVANKCKALEVGLRVFNHYSRMGIPLEPTTPRIYLMKEFGAVFKFSDDMYMERLVESLFNLCDSSVQSCIVPSFKFGTLEATRFGFSTLTYLEQRRAIPAISLQSGYKEPKCSPIQQKLGEALEGSSRILWRELLKHEIRYWKLYGENTHFEIDEPQGKRRVAFSDLQLNSLSEDFVRSYPSTVQALFHRDKEAGKDVFFIPVLDDPKIKSLYEEFENLEWTIRTQDKTENLQFRTLQELWLDGRIDTQTLSAADIEVRKVHISHSKPNDQMSRPFTRHLDLLAVLQVKWKMVTPAVYVKHKKNYIPLPSNFLSRPWRNFVTFRQIIEGWCPQFLNYILERVSERSQVAALTISMLQPLDFHEDNLSVESTFFGLFKSAMKNFQFQYEGEQFDFLGLAERYKTKKIQDTTPFAIMHKNSPPDISTLELAKISGVTLKQLLEHTFNFVFFDLERFLDESNSLTQVKRKVFPMVSIPSATPTQAPKENLEKDSKDRNLSEAKKASPLPDKNSAGEKEPAKIVPFEVTEHIIPFRSALFHFPLKLSSRDIIEETNRILKEMRSWMAKPLPSVRSFLSPELDGQISQLFDSRLRSKDFQLFPWEDSKVLPQLRHDFATHLSDLTSHSDLWCEVQKALMSSYTRKPFLSRFKPYHLKEGDTLGTIATCFRLSLEELQHLNPQGSGVVGGALTVVPPYNANTPAAARHRYHMAWNFFGRVTSRQLQCFDERFTRLSNYLTKNTELEQLQIGEDNIETAKQFILTLIDDASPLYSREKLTYKSWLQFVNEPKALTDVKNKLSQAYQVGYKNIMKAIFPLLPDASILHQHMYRTKKHLVNFEYSLEQTIRRGKKTNTNDKRHLIAIDLEDKIRSALANNDAGFFHNMPDHESINIPYI